MSFWGCFIPQNSNQGLQIRIILYVPHVMGLTQKWPSATHLSTISALEHKQSTEQKSVTPQTTQTTSSLSGCKTCICSSHLSNQIIFCRIEDSSLFPIYPHIGTECVGIQFINFGFCLFQLLLVIKVGFMFQYPKQYGMMVIAFHCLALYMSTLDDYDIAKLQLSKCLKMASSIHSYDHNPFIANFPVVELILDYLRHMFQSWKTRCKAKSPKTSKKWKLLEYRPIST